jgi:hypothetical protein
MLSEERRTPSPRQERRRQLLKQLGGVPHRTFDPSLPPTFSHLISPAQRNILAPAGKIILE